MNLVGDFCHVLVKRKCFAKHFRNYAYPSLKRDLVGEIIENTYNPKSSHNDDLCIDDERTTSGLFSQSKYCYYCSGNMYIKCYTCHGKGKVYMEGMREYLCNNCNNSGDIVCSMCDRSV